MVDETFIHPTAIIEKGAEIGARVSIGAYSIIGANVKIGDDCFIEPHVVINGHTEIDERNTFHSFSSIGATPQDLSYKGEPTRVQIGKNNVFREFVSISRGTMKQDQITQIGNDGVFMAYVHLGHDVQIGNGVRIVNACNLAGHVKIDDGAILSGGTNVSQFVTIGKGAFIGGSSGIDRDIPCYTTAYGNRVKLKGINIVGIRRLGFDKPAVSEVVEFFRTMEASALSPRAFVEQKEILVEFSENKIIKQMIEFIMNSKIGIAPFMS